MKKIFCYLLPLAMMFAFTGCKSDKTEAGPQQPSRVLTDKYQIKDYLNGLTNAPGLRSEKEGDIENNGKPVMAGSPVEVKREPAEVNGVPGFWVTTTTKYKMTQAFDESILLDPSVDILYPGCVLRAASIADGTYAAISDCKVGDVTFSISKIVAPGEDTEAVKHTVNNIRMADYRSQFNKWAHLHYVDGPVTAMHSLESVQSIEEAKLKLGASFQHKVVDISANLGFDFEKSENHILAKFIQKQFAVTMDFPKTPTLFAEIDTEYINTYKPVYVSNINYGRMIFMAIDSKHSLAEVRTALNVAVKAVNLKIDLDQQYKKVLDESKINVTVIGGNAKVQNGPLVDGWEGFVRYMTKDIPMEQMTPISFSMRYASDNSLARVVSSVEYDITRKDFVPEFKKLQVTVKMSGLHATGGNESGDYDIYGRGWVTVGGKDVATFFNHDKKAYVGVPKDQEKNLDEKNTYVVLSKPDNMSYEEFKSLRVKFNTHFLDDDGIYNDKDYGVGEQEFTIADLIALQKSPTPNFVITSNGSGVTVKARIQVVSTDYLKK